MDKQSINLQEQYIKRPRVSVVMPAYNAARYIAEAIGSVQAQTMTDWELLVLDDGSSDDTCQIVEVMARSDSRIRLLVNAHNLGPALTRNRGLDLCRGQYVALLDSDDLWHPEKLEKQLALASSAGADVIYCSYGIVDEAGQKCCNDFLVPDKTDYRSMLISSVISCSTALLSERVYRNYHFPHSYYHEDYALWLWLMRDGIQAQGNREVLASYRIQSESRASNKFTSACRRWVIYRRFLKMSLLESVYYLSRYAVAGARKYRYI